MNGSQAPRVFSEACMTETMSHRDVFFTATVTIKRLLGSSPVPLTKIGRDRLPVCQLRPPGRIVDNFLNFFGDESPGDGLV